MPPIPKLDPDQWCIACSGSGVSSMGFACVPCGGTGRPEKWTCPTCKRVHRGFRDLKCRNEKCPDYKR